MIFLAVVLIVPVALAVTLVLLVPHGGDHQSRHDSSMSPALWVVIYLPVFLAIMASRRRGKGGCKREAER